MMDGGDVSPLLGMSQRQPPSNIQAEQALLGALMANNKQAYRRVSAFLRPEHFADPIHGRIFAEIARLTEADRLADAVTLKGVFERNGALEEVGGTSYLAQLLTAMVGVINAGEYGRAIHDAWVRRQLIEFGTDLVNEAFAGAAEQSGADLVDTGADTLLSLAHVVRSAETRETTLDDALDQATQAIGKPEGIRGLMTGITSLDIKWRGRWPGEMDILAGRPGAGKTALAVQIALADARRLRDAGTAGCVGIWSWEMRADALAMRLLSAMTRISVDDLRGTHLSEQQAAAVVQARRELRGLPIRIRDRPGLTLSQFRAEAREMRERHGMVSAVVDHVRKFGRDKIEARYQEKQFLEAASGGCHDIAQTFDFHLLLLWHLSKDQERRGDVDGRPRLADLMYGGEGDADNVLMLWQPLNAMPAKPPELKRGNPEAQAKIEAEWNTQRERWRDRVEVVFAKRRSGPSGAVTLGFDGSAMRFFDIDQEADMPEPPPDLWGQG